MGDQDLAGSLEDTRPIRIVREVRDAERRARSEATIDGLVDLYMELHQKSAEILGRSGSPWRTNAGLDEIADCMDDILNSRIAQSVSSRFYGHIDAHTIDRIVSIARVSPYAPQDTARKLVKGAPKDQARMWKHYFSAPRDVAAVLSGDKPYGNNSMESMGRVARLVSFLKYIDDRYVPAQDGKEDRFMSGFIMPTMEHMADNLVRRLYDSRLRHRRERIDDMSSELRHYQSTLDPQRPMHAYIHGYIERVVGRLEKTLNPIHKALLLADDLMAKIAGTY